MTILISNLKETAGLDYTAYLIAMHFDSEFPPTLLRHETTIIIDIKVKQKYLGMFETQKSGNKTS